MPESFSLAEARRVALAAQGFPRRRRAARPSTKTIHDAVRRQGVLQIDSVNVLARAHYMPLFSRLGPYDTNALDRLTFRDRELFEAWSHAASLVPVELWPHHQFRRAGFERDWSRYMTPQREAYFAAVLAEVEASGPISAGELEDPGRPKAGPWFDRSGGKTALEYLFGIGAVAVADRRNFERVYDLTERVIPSDVLRASVTTEDDARRELVVRATRALGVGTVDDIADYFRLKIAPTRKALRELVESGDVVEVAVEAWTAPAYAPARVRVPKAVAGHALVNPFDPLAWRRQRTARLFEFAYTIEIYVPPPKRVYGYYVLPFLLEEAFVARVDLKADRKERTLRVFAAWHEPGVDVPAVAEALAGELALAAEWLGLDAIHVQPKGNLSKRLATAVRGT